MFTSSLKIRGFNAGCAHEIILPNGKTIIIDPFFVGPHMEGHSIDEITGADYILITHSHFDHDFNLGELVKKFNSKVYTGPMAAVPLIKYHQLPYDNVFPIYPNQSIVTDDFTLTALQGKHNPTGGRTYRPELDICMEAIGVSGHKECDDIGNIETTDYMITTNNSFKLLTVSGQMHSNDHLEWCRKNAPNLVLRQAGVRKGGGDLFAGGQVSPEELAEIMVKYHGQIIMPFHMDVLCRQLGTEETNAYFDKVTQHVKQLDPGAVFIHPEPWKWYDIGMSIC